MGRRQKTVVTSEVCPGSQPHEENGPGLVEENKTRERLPRYESSIPNRGSTQVRTNLPRYIVVSYVRSVCVGVRVVGTLLLGPFYCYDLQDFFSFAEILRLTSYIFLVFGAKIKFNSRIGYGGKSLWIPTPPAIVIIHF